ncbi:MAG: hypothetical protein ACREX9_11160, partial [Gammaproteobacteria bacterium]
MSPSLGNYFEYLTSANAPVSQPTEKPNFCGEGPKNPGPTSVHGDYVNGGDKKFADFPPSSNVTAHAPG